MAQVAHLALLPLRPSAGWEWSCCVPQRTLAGNPVLLGLHWLASRPETLRLQAGSRGGPLCVLLLPPPPPTASVCPGAPCRPCLTSRCLPQTEESFVGCSLILLFSQITRSFVFLGIEACCVWQTWSLSLGCGSPVCGQSPAASLGPLEPGV